MAVLVSIAAVLLVGLSKLAYSSTFVCNDDYDCFPNGTCGSDLSCVCQPGFSGERCEVPCPLKCQNGGQCIMIDEHGGLVEENEFYCDCPPSHKGGLCQDPIPFLCNDDYDCQPHGVCGPELSCLCEAGFWGEQCNEPCPIQCQNGGQCVMVDEHGGLVEANEFYCDCPSDYSGGLCQNRRSDAAEAGASSSSSNSRGLTIGIVLVVLLAVIGVALIALRCRRTRKESASSPNLETENAGGAEDSDLPSVA